MEDGDTLLVTGDQYRVGNRDMDSFIGRSIRALGKLRNRHEFFFQQRKLHPYMGARD